MTSALDMAIGRGGTAPGLVHHSDRGTQYNSFAFGHRLRESGNLPSMGRTGDAYDNAMCESFFASLECELLDRSHFVSREAARVAIFEWLETWYNSRRRHSSLDYLAPLEYERRVAAAGCDHLVFDGPRNRGNFSHWAAPDPALSARGRVHHTGRRLARLRGAAGSRGRRSRGAGRARTTSPDRCAEVRGRLRRLTHGWMRRAGRVRSAALQRALRERGVARGYQIQNADD